MTRTPAMAPLRVRWSAAVLALGLNVAAISVLTSWIPGSDVVAGALITASAVVVFARGTRATAIGSGLMLVVGAVAIAICLGGWLLPRAGQTLLLPAAALPADVRETIDARRAAAFRGNDEFDVPIRGVLPCEDEELIGPLVYRGLTSAVANGQVYLLLRMADPVDGAEFVIDPAAIPATAPARWAGTAQVLEASQVVPRWGALGAPVRQAYQTLWWFGKLRAAARISAQ